MLPDSGRGGMVRPPCARGSADRRDLRDNRASKPCRQFAMRPSALVARCLAALLVAATCAYPAQVAPSAAERAGYSGPFRRRRARRRRRNRAARRRGRRTRARVTATAARRCIVAAFASQRERDARAGRGGRRSERARERPLRHRHHRRRGERPADACRTRWSWAGARRTSRAATTAPRSSPRRISATSKIVRELIRAGAPLDHVNNLGWTALIESIVLGDGGPRHTATLDGAGQCRRERESRRSRRRVAAAARARPRLSRDERGAGKGGRAIAARASSSCRPTTRAAQRPPHHRPRRLAARHFDESGTIEHRLGAEPHEVVDTAFGLVAWIRFEQLRAAARAPMPSRLSAVLRRRRDGAPSRRRKNTRSTIPASHRPASSRASARVLRNPRAGRAIPSRSARPFS